MANSAVTWLLLGASLAAVVGVPGVGYPQGMLFAAHRGGARLWPENSLLAFRRALELGADFVELDVHLARDGQVVVIHDPTLERTTTGMGEVRATTLPDLQKLRLRDSGGSRTDEPVPMLEEVLDLVAPSAAALLLEIKTALRRERYNGVEDRVLELLRARGLGARTVVTSYETAVLRRVRELDSAIRTGLVVSEWSLDRQGASPETAIEWATVAGATDIAFQYTLLAPAVLATARQRGLRVAAWTVNDDAEMRRMIELGVDIVITDRPDLAKEVLRR